MLGFLTERLSGSTHDALQVGLLAIFAVITFSLYAAARGMMFSPKARLAKLTLLAMLWGILTAGIVKLVFLANLSIAMVLIAITPVLIAYVVIRNIRAAKFNRRFDEVYRQTYGT